MAGDSVRADPTCPAAAGGRCLALAAALLAACASPLPAPETEAGPQGEVKAPAAAQPDKKPGPAAKRRGGGYYQDDGPGDEPPENLHLVPDAQPRAEALHRFANNPYAVFGREYVPFRELRPYKSKGIASWYGRKFHGQATSSGEAYDMYGMTAAHPTLPIPSYARVTSLDSGRSVVVRINDRGPFHADRLIDLSYTAAYKLGFVDRGSARVEVETVLPEGLTYADIAPLPAGKRRAPVPPPATDKEDPLATLAALETGGEAGGSAALAGDAPGGRIYLQLGAFASLDKAERMAAELKRKLSGVAERLHVQQGDGKFRLHLGPYPTVQHARRTATRLAETLGLKALQVLR